MTSSRNPMPDDSYMDAAAVPVPDGGDDTLREQLIQTVAGVIWRIHGPESTDRESAEQDGSDITDALLPQMRAHVAAAVQAERERIAAAIDEAAPHMTVIGAHGMEIAARIARLDPEQVDTP